MTVHVLVIWSAIGALLFLASLAFTLWTERTESAVTLAMERAAHEDARRMIEKINARAQWDRATMAEDMRIAKAQLLQKVTEAQQLRGFCDELSRAKCEQGKTIDQLLDRLDSLMDKSEPTRALNMALNQLKATEDELKVAQACLVKARGDLDEARAATRQRENRIFVLEAKVRADSARIAELIRSRASIIHRNEVIVEIARRAKADLEAARNRTYRESIPGAGFVILRGSARGGDPMA